MSSPTSFTLLHVDASARQHDWLRQILGGCPDIGFSGHARTAREAVQVCRVSGPKAVITEVLLPDVEGFQFIEDISRLQHPPRILAFTEAAGDWPLYRLSRSPVHGVVWKTDDAAVELPRAVEAVKAGSRYFSEETREAIAKLRRQPDAFFKLLSNIEIKVLPLFGKGSSDWEVSRLMSLSPFTIRSHRHSIMRKLGLHRHRELMMWCVHKGVVPIERPPPPCEMLS